ncbi:mediator of DNA damage checkpoint protein 1 isoform X2 [Stigmatopora argus]
MEATQAINDSFLESDEETNEEEKPKEAKEPVAKLCIFKNDHVPEREFPLFMGDNILGRDVSICTLPLLAPSISKQHATISISVHRRRGSRKGVDMEALVWDLGSMNGTRKGRLKLTPNVRYALSEGDHLVMADVPCQYVKITREDRTSEARVSVPVEKTECVKASASRDSQASTTVSSVGVAKKLLQNSCVSLETTPVQTLGTLVPESDSDSESEESGHGEVKRQLLGSESETHQSSQICSTFLSPANKIVPESPYCEDESPAIPSSSTRKKPHGRVSFSPEKSTMDVGGQQKKHTLTMVDDSDEDGSVQNDQTLEKATLKESKHIAPEQLKSPARFSEDKLSQLSTGSVSKFNMDSDTDVEEDGGEAEPALDQKPKAACFHMDSDTDVDDKDDAVTGGASTSLQPKAGHEVRDMSPSAKIADMATPVLPGDFQLDSDTDVDEEADSTAGDETPSKMDLIKDMSGSVEDQSPSCSTHPDLKDSTTGSNNSNAMRESSQFSPVATTPSSVAHGITATAAQLDCESSVPPTDQDSDTDVEEGKNPIHLEGMKKSHQQNCSTPVLLSGGVEEMDTQAFFSSSPGLWKGLDSPEEEDMVVADTQYFVPQTQEQIGSGLNNVSRALDHEISGKDLEEFPVIGASFQLALSDNSNLQSEAQALPREGTQAFGMVAEAETQIFSNTSNAETTSLGNDLNKETSQGFRSPSRSPGILKRNRHVVLALQETQLYVSEPYGESEEDTEEETQPLDLPKNPAIDLLTTQSPSVASLQQNQISKESDLRKEQEQVPLLEEKKIQLDKEMQSDTSSRGFANRQLISLAATQPMAMSETEESDDDGSVLLEENVQPNLISHGLAACKKSLSIAATQPLPTSENEESTDEDLTQDMLQPNTSLAANHFMSIAATQPIANSENEETDSEDPIPVLREGQVQLDKEIQPKYSIAATQPLATIQNESDDEEDSIPILRNKRKARQLQDTQSLCSTFETPSDSSTCRNPSKDCVKDPPKPGTTIQSMEEETQSNVQTLANNEENRSGHGHEKEQTQALVSSQVSSASTQLMDSCEDDSEILICSSRKRKARPLQIDDETQSLVGSQTEMKSREMENSETSAVESRSPTCDKSTPKSEKSPSEIRTSQTAHSKTLSQLSEKEESLDKRQTRGTKVRGQTGSAKSESQATRQQGNLLEVQNRDPKQQHEVTESKRTEETSRSETVDEEERLERPETKAKRQKVDGAKMEPQQNNLSKPQLPRRSQREKRTTIVPLSTAVLDDAPAKRTRSRSNSSNSVSSEVSTSSTQRSQGYGQSTKTSNRSGPSCTTRRRTVAANPSGFPDKSEQDKSLDSPLGSLSRSTSSNSLASEMSCSSSSRGSRSRQRVSERKKEPEPSSIQSTLSPNPGPKATPGGKRSRKTEVSTTEVSHEAVNKPESKQVVATRGKRQANVEQSSNLANNTISDSPPPPKRNIRGKGKSQVLEAPVARRNEVEAEDKREGRRRMLEVNVKDENPAKIQDKRRTRASCVQVDKNAKEFPYNMVESGTSVGGSGEGVQPQTPISNKRRTRDSSHSYKVLFTGVVDQAGEKVVTRLGGVLANGTADMNCLVTDMVRRTVKFLCAVAKGIPIVNTQWLHKSAQAGTFLPPEAFMLNDPEQELKFNFCLQETLRLASREPLLKGYKIHITKSVKPEPVHMKDIISCCGATFTPKMPSTNKPYTLVVSCPEDWPLCRRAVSASLPIVTAEFILSGVLRHKVDYDTHKLSVPLKPTNAV